MVLAAEMVFDDGGEYGEEREEEYSRDSILTEGERQSDVAKGKSDEGGALVVAMASDGDGGDGLWCWLGSTRKQTETMRDESKGGEKQ